MGLGIQFRRLIQSCLVPRVLVKNGFTVHQLGLVSQNVGVVRLCITGDKQESKQELNMFV